MRRAPLAKETSSREKTQDPEKKERSTFPNGPDPNRHRSVSPLEISSAWEGGQSTAERDQVQHMMAACSGHKHQCCNSAWARRKHIAQHVGMKAKSTEAAEAKGTQMFHHAVNAEWETQEREQSRVLGNRDGSSRSSEALSSTLSLLRTLSVLMK